MSQFLPETPLQAGDASGIKPATEASLTDADLQLAARVVGALAARPQQLIGPLMGYITDAMGISNLLLPIGQIVGYKRIAPQVITSFAQIPDPVDGQIILLKLGSGAPYIYVQMMYDDKSSQWVSEEFPAGGGAAQLAIDGFTPFGGYTGISWKPVHTGGLTMQIKWAGTLENEAGGTGDARVELVWATPSGSYTTSNMLTASVPGDAVTRAVGADWTTVSDPGDYNMVAIGMSAGRNSGSGGTTVVRAGVVGRFIK